MVDSLDMMDIVVDYDDEIVVVVVAVVVNIVDNFDMDNFDDYYSCSKTFYKGLFFQ